MRGPLSPPLSPPGELYPQKRSSTSTSNGTRRFFSLTSGLMRTSTTSSSKTSHSQYRRTVSGPPNGVSRASSSASRPGSGDRGSEYMISDYEMRHVRCEKPIRRDLAGGAGNVCKICEGWIREMRFMIERYEKTRNVKGTKAFEEFLKRRGECMVETGVGFGVEGKRSERGVEVDSLYND